MKKEELWTGDLLIQPASGWVGYLTALLTGSKWVHCGIVVHSNFGETLVCDVYPLQGKRFTQPEEWVGSEVLRVKPDFVAQMKVANWAVTTEVKRYSVLSGLKAMYFPSRRDSGIVTGYYNCAGFVSYCFRKAGFDVVPHRSDRSTLPFHFFNGYFETKGTLK